MRYFQFFFVGVDQSRREIEVERLNKLSLKLFLGKQISAAVFLISWKLSLIECWMVGLIQLILNLLEVETKLWIFRIKLMNPSQKASLEDEHHKIISECSEKLVALSLQYQKEEKERKEKTEQAGKKNHDLQQNLREKREINQNIADKKVNSYCILRTQIIKLI